ncbi:MAG TPA: VC0807 family protein [Acidimicrobiales bacterium]|nr:VC0807 family protein [Acidimicrobiales bacterium]
MGGVALTTQTTPAGDLDDQPARRPGSESEDQPLPRAANTIHLPAPRAFLRHALPGLIESTVGPVALFYAMLSLLGLRGALIATLGFSYVALARRVVTGRPVPGMLVLACALLTVRTAMALATGSAFVYFLQPTLGTFLVAGAFLISVPAGRPLAERLAQDFCPLDPALLRQPWVRRFFLRVSLLWTFVFLSNATLTLWLLLTYSVKSFVLLKTAASLFAIGSAIVVSAMWFRRALHGEGFSLHWSVRVKPAPAR